MRWTLRFLTLLLLTLLCAIAAADPRSHYMIHCMGCHLNDGSGLPPEVPAFDNNLAILAASAKGREYLVRVPGASQSLIDDAALAGVLNWILDEYADEPAHKPFLASEISRYRHKPLTHPARLRDELLGAAD
jgi:cytochrome c peroxidase